MPQKIFAKHAAMTMAEVSRIECGHHTPSGRTIERIAGACGMRVAFVEADVEET